MPKEVRVRDLPGGPVDIEFSDDVSRRCTCTKCRMIASMMYMDPNEHAFCEHCINECSAQRKIYCSEERKDIDFNVMEEAFTVITILAKMKVFCPNRNKGCESTIEFRRLKDHFMECDKTLLKCECCRKSLKGKEYKSHKLSCSKKIVQCPYCFKAEPQATLKEHKKRCGEEMTRCSKCADDILKKDYKLHEYQCTGVKKRKKEDQNVRPPALTSAESTDLQHLVPDCQRGNLVTGPLVTSRGNPEEDQNVRPPAVTSAESTGLQRFLPPYQREDLVSGPPSLVTSGGYPEEDQNVRPPAVTSAESTGLQRFLPPYQREDLVSGPPSLVTSGGYPEGFAESSYPGVVPAKEPLYPTSITSSFLSCQHIGGAEQKPISQVVSESEESENEQRRNHVCSAQNERGTVGFLKGFVESNDQQGALVQEPLRHTSTTSFFFSCPSSMEAEQKPISQTSFHHIPPGSNGGAIQASTLQPERDTESFEVLSDRDFRTLEQEQQSHQKDAAVQVGNGRMVHKEVQVDVQPCLNNMVQISRDEHQEFLTFKKEKERLNNMVQISRDEHQEFLTFKKEKEDLVQKIEMLKEQVRQLQLQPQHQGLMMEAKKNQGMPVILPPLGPENVLVQGAKVALPGQTTSQHQRTSECGEIPRAASTGWSVSMPDWQREISQPHRMSGHGEYPSAGWEGRQMATTPFSSHGISCHVDSSLQSCGVSSSGGSQNRPEYTRHLSSSKSSFQGTQQHGEFDCVGSYGPPEFTRPLSNLGDSCQKAEVPLRQRTPSYGTLPPTGSNGMSEPVVTSEPRANGNGRAEMHCISTASRKDRKHKGKDSYENKDGGRQSCCCVC